MSPLTTVALLFGAYILLRRRSPSRSARIVPADPKLHAEALAWRRHQHDTFSERHEVKFK